MSAQHPLPEDLAACALDSLEPSERAQIVAHVESCAVCTRAVDEYRAVAGALPFGLERVAAPPEAWRAILDGARRARPRDSAPSWLSRLFVLGPRRRFVVPALAAAAIVLLVWNITLQRELRGYREGPQVDALARRPGRLVILRGANAPAASARLLIASDGGHGHMAIAGLAPLPPDRTYQIWFVRTNAPAVSGGVFTDDTSGRAWASVDPPPSLDDVRAIMVTEEPAPGSAAPTGGRLVSAEEWR